jgi:DNA-binding winged helix-turn-helix (wHTH) protein/tetratricopeptide (TPR) repeat protein
MSADLFKGTYAFGDFALDARRRLLTTRAGQVQPLTTKSFDTLLHLVEHAGAVVTKVDLMAAVWPHVRVEENSLSQCISTLRRVLGEDSKEHRYIVTVPGRGYRFIAEVTREAAHTPNLPQASPGKAADTPRNRALAVLPFKPLGSAHSPESLGLGMADAVIMRIGRLPGIQLRPLSSVVRYADRTQDPLEAGQLLGVEDVLDGWVQHDGERLRASVRLLEVASGRQRWADHFDERLTDIFTIQDAIAERVAAALLAKITGGDLKHLRHHPTENVDAYQLYVTGWSALTRPGGGNLEHALKCLEQAVSLDPGFALAHVCVSDCYALHGVMGLRAPHDVFPQARAAVLKALEIDPELAEAHSELGHIHMVYDLDWRRAHAAQKRALQINPRSAMAHHYMGLLMVPLDRLDEALDHVRHAQSLEPLAVNYNANIGMIHYYAGRYETAIAQLEATLELDVSFDHARSFLGRALLRLGEPEQALAQFKRRTSTTIGSAADIPTALALSGRTIEAQRELGQLLQMAQRQYVSPFDIATIYVALNQTEQSLEWLERALEQRAQPIMALRHDPAFRNLHPSPRFQRILQRLESPSDRRIP